MTRFTQALPLLMAALLLPGCSDATETATAETTQVATESPDGPGGKLLYSGELDIEINDLTWSMIEHVPAASTPIAGFDLQLRSRKMGMFNQILSISGIPWDLTLNQPIPIVLNKQQGSVSAIFAEDMMNVQAPGAWTAVSGTLTITEYGDELSGHLEAELTSQKRHGVATDPGASKPTARVQGSFNNLPAIHPVEK